MEINATITSRSGMVKMAVTRTTPPRRLVSQHREPAPVVYRNDWWGPESVTVAILDPGEGK